MTVRRIIAGGALVLVTALVTSQVVSQDKPEMSDKEKQMMEAMARYGSPGEYHKHLEPLVGEWTYTIEWWEYPDAEAHKDTGTVESMWALGGRFVLQHVMGDEPMGPGGDVFEGHGCIGYDNFRQEYTSAWISNMQTSISTSRGTVDATGKTFTFWGTHDDIMTGERDKPVREIIKIVDHNTHTVEWFEKRDTGEEFKSGQLVFTRKTKGEGASVAPKKEKKKYRD